MIHATEASYASGSGMQSSVVRAALAETELTERLVMLEADADMRRLALNGAMGRELATPIGALDDDPAGSDRAALAALLEEAAAAILSSARPAREIATSDAALEAARAEGKPDWVIQGGYMLMPGEAGAWTARVGPDVADGALGEEAPVGGDPRGRGADPRRAGRPRSQPPADRADGRAKPAPRSSARWPASPSCATPCARSRLTCWKPRVSRSPAGKVPLSEVVDAQKMQLQTEVDIAQDDRRCRHRVGRARSRRR